METNLQFDRNLTGGRTGSKKIDKRVGIGRGERIRTSDHFTPSEVRYQAALRPEGADYSRAGITTDKSFMPEMLKYAWNIRFKPEPQVRD